MQHEARLIRIAVAQQRREVAIDFDRIEPTGGLQQALRERSAARSDLDRRVARFEIDCRYDARNDRRVMQEMLAEAPARAPVRDAQTCS
jgi:hypothetical protein